MNYAEWLPLKRVAMRSPEEVVNDQNDIAAQWRALNYLDPPDLEEAVREHAVFRATLQDCGVEIVDLKMGRGLSLDGIYVRDTGLSVPGGVIVARMGKGAREPEPRVLTDLLIAAQIPIAGTIFAPGTLEGGDCVWIDEQTLLIGRTYRTNDDGIRQVREILGPGFTVLSFELPHYKGPDDVFHLMSVLSPVARNAAVVYRPLMPIPLVEFLLARDIRLLDVPDQEFFAMGCNVLALGNQKVVAVAGHPQIRASLDRAGFDVLEISGTHICHPGQGGPTCLTLPLHRASD